MATGSSQYRGVNKLRSQAAADRPPKIKRTAAQGRKPRIRNISDAQAKRMGIPF